MGDQNVVWVTRSGATSYGPESDVPADFGAKARGLLWLPPAWVPPFFVISPDIREEFRGLPFDGRRAFIEHLRPILNDAARDAGISTDGSVLLRSNAVRETLRERGRYSSKVADVQTLASALVELYETTNIARSADPMGIIVQHYIPARLKGHLSNERRVAEEYRDSQVEIESPTGELTESRISFRRWRTGRRADEGALACASSDELTSVLRQLLALSAQRTKRVHFEWLWDGSFVHVVQADVADERPVGVSPEAVLRQHDRIEIEPTNLRCFTTVSQLGENATGKLKKHANYAQHGFWQPTFYTLESELIIEKILRGDRDEALESDLTILTSMPLVIRTSCTDNTGPLLPRSNQLTTAQQARDWLYTDFAQTIKERKLGPSCLSLLAHHYIPARAAAFSTGSADRLDVYVESLWGIPEGLYYYPFDSFIIKTTGTDPSSVSEQDYERFEIKKHPHYKSHFVAPNSAGQFACYELGAPWDWKQTIRDPRTLRRIAAFTRILAQQESHPVSVMWFISCWTTSGVIDVMPWYHERLVALPTESSFRRNARDEIITISSRQELDALERRPIAARTPSQGRLVVELSPIEDQAIRNESFATRVGIAAKRLDATVVLNGASLSHIYYILSRTGAEIVVRQLADAASRREIHEKLVRDRIPDVVAAGGEVAHIANLNREETVAALRIKLVEEAFEVRDATREELIGELADVMEVLESLAVAAGLNLRDVRKIRKRKAARRGGFQEGVVLISTEASHPSQHDSLLLPTTDNAESRVVTSEKPPPLERVRAGPADVRNNTDFIEFVQNGSVSLTHPQWTIEASRRTPLPRNLPVNYLDWSIDGQRQGTTLRLRLKVRIGSSQLELPFFQQAIETPEDDADPD